MGCPPDLLLVTALPTKYTAGFEQSFGVVSYIRTLDLIICMIDNVYFLVNHVGQPF